MKILRVISSLDPKMGGPVEGIKQFQSYLSTLGAEVQIVCCDTPDSLWLKDKRLPIVYALGPMKNSYGFSPKLLPWLKENVCHYDAVIVHGLWQYHGLAVWRALRKASVPYYVLTHGMLDPWFKHTYPLKHLKKWLYWPWAEYRILRDARKVIFTCEEERLLARKSFWLYKANEAVTAYGITNPPDNIEILQTKFLNQYSSLQNKRVILFLSRIQEKKGCDLLIEAFSKVVNQDEKLHLVMAGPDQTGWVTKLKTQAERLGVADRITWTGILQGDMKWGAFYTADVFCLPSHQENFGIVVAEALACGKPVLISNKVNIWREIEMDNVGFVADDTLEGTIKNLESWLSMSPNDFGLMEDCAKICFSNRFHAQSASASFLDIIR